jgi:hypothetical protein
MSQARIYLVLILCILAMATTAEARWPFSTPDPTQVCAERAERLAKSLEVPGLYGRPWDGPGRREAHRADWIKGKTSECLAAQLNEPIR